MHELSQTIIRGNKYVNVSGHNGEPLKPMFPYEKHEYDTLDEATGAAEQRSNDFGKALDSSLDRHEEADDAKAGRVRKTLISP